MLVQSCQHEGREVREKGSNALKFLHNYRVLKRSMNRGSPQAIKPATNVTPRTNVGGTHTFNYRLVGKREWLISQ